MIRKLLLCFKKSHAVDYRGDISDDNRNINFISIKYQLIQHIISKLRQLPDATTEE